MKDILCGLGRNSRHPLATTIKHKHSGYLHIWVNNEAQNWMVFFDNLSIEDFSGPMLEEVIAGGNPSVAITANTPVSIPKNGFISGELKIPG